MSDNMVTTTFLANPEQALAAFVKLQKQFEDFKNAARHAHKSHNEGAGEVIEKMGEMAKAAAVMGVGFSSLEGFVDGVTEATREWRTEADGAAIAIDKANRAFAVRTGGPGSEKLLESAREKGDAAGLAHADSDKLFGDIKNRGFTPEEIDKKFADVAAGFAVARTATGVDPAAFAGAVKASMDRDPDAPKDAAALAKGARDVVNMTRGSSMTADDVGAFGEILETLKAGKGGLHNPKHEKALRDMKLKPADVDLVGEDFATAVGRIGAGLENVPREDRMATMKLLTGDAGMARRVMGGIGKMKENDTQYDELVDIQTSGPAAGAQRSANRKEHRLAAQGNAAFSTFKESAAVMRQEVRGQDPILSVMQDKAVAKAYGLGGERAGSAVAAVNPEKGMWATMASFLPGGSFLGPALNASTAGENVELVKTLKEQNELLKQGLEAQKKAAEHLEKGNEQREEGNEQREAGNQRNRPKPRRQAD